MADEDQKREEGSHPSVLVVASGHHSVDGQTADLSLQNPISKKPDLQTASEHQKKSSEILPTAIDAASLATQIREPLKNKASLAPSTKSDEQQTTQSKTDLASERKQSTVSIETKEPEKTLVKKSESEKSGAENNPKENKSSDNLGNERKESTASIETKEPEKTRVKKSESQKSVAENNLKELKSSEFDDGSDKTSPLVKFNSEQSNQQPDQPDSPEREGFDASGNSLVLRAFRALFCCAAKPTDSSEDNTLKPISS